MMAVKSSRSRKDIDFVVLLVASLVVAFSVPQCANHETLVRFRLSLPVSRLAFSSFFSRKCLIRNQLLADCITMGLT